MEFNKIIKDILLHTFLENGFVIYEEFENTIRLKSNLIEINMFFNKYERSNIIEIGKLDGFLYPLNNTVIINLFNSDLKIEQVTSEIFAKNLAVIFEQPEGINILNGNIERLEMIIKKISEDYTFDLILKGKLLSASQAWLKNDFKTFIEILEKIQNNKIPELYLLKYKYAKLKIKK